VKLRVIGDRSQGWAEVGQSWGGKLEAVVHINHPNHRLCNSLSLQKSCDATTASLLPLQGRWDGVAFATISTSQESQVVTELLDTWRPLIALVALPGHCRRNHLRHKDPSRRLLPLTPPDYTQLEIGKLQHRQFGGVTATA